MSTSATMKAWVVPEKGGRDILQYQDVPVPTISSTQVLVKNEYGGLNMVDSYFRSGLYPQTYPYITGREGAGKVVAIGSEVTSFAVGDRVAYMVTGAFAEFVAVPAAGAIVKLADSIPTQIAAASMLQVLTALTLVKDSYAVKPGDFVLINAAAGGVGQILCQLVKSLGGHAIGCVSTDAKAKLASAAGAEYVINYIEVPDYVPKIMEITNGKGCQVVYDGVGKSTFNDCLRAVARLGSVITFGNASGPVDPLNLITLSQKNIKLMRPTLFNYLTTPEEFKYWSGIWLDYLKDGKLNIAIYKTYPIAEYVSAAEALETRKSTGKVVLKY
ncbi:uncharacterized protein V1516DRAFT_667130 [Lipomyces oligophaga]|uniref:uncharacterized protein n=1 Tax=Lipomyces oligophaga TaxID=45792 RepID=UPI0034CF3EE6